MLAQFRTAAGERYFEDYVPGAVHDCGSVVVSEEDVLTFATRFDPQYFHADPKRAAQSMYGGLIASGWHTAALMMRQLVDHFVSHVASLGSPGVDELRWFAPVRPGDTLSMRASILSARRSRSNPTRGIVNSLVEVSNQDEVVVMSVKTVSMFLCRERTESAEPSTD